MSDLDKLHARFLAAAHAYGLASSRLVDSAVAEDGLENLWHESLKQAMAALEDAARAWRDAERDAQCALAGERVFS